MHPSTAQPGGLAPLSHRLVEGWRGLLTVQSLPWVVLALGLVGTAAVCEQTRRFGVQEHQRI
ncbi:MAG: hypothetical protein ACKO0M_17760 [Cyanobium sp.]